MKRRLALLALAAWLVSFALPTIDMGGPRGAAAGLGAAFFAFWVAPTVGLLLSIGAVHTADIPFALLMAAYFPALAVGNVIVPLSLARRIDLGRLPLVFAVLATGVPLTPWPELWRVLELAFGDQVHLDVGYLVWLSSLWLLVFSRFART